MYICNLTLLSMPMTMLKLLLDKYSGRFLSRWIVLLIDTFIVTFLFHFAVIIRSNFDFQEINIPWLYERNIWVSLVFFLTFFITGSYRGIIRQTGLRDAYLIVKASSIGFVFLVVVSVLGSYDPSFDFFAVPRSVLLIHYLLSMVALVALRFFVKSTYILALKQQRGNRRTRVIIFGSGAAGEITRQSLQRELTTLYEVVAFIDDNPSKHGKIQDGIPVFSREKGLDKAFIEDKRIHQLIIAVQNLSAEKRRELIEQGIDLNIKVKVVPPVSNWIQGQLTINQIKEVRIEDLLERETIKLNSANISREFQDKIVLVTGAAGSIGSEILRQILHYSPKEVIAIDQAESALYELEMELLYHRPNHHLKTRFVVADITRKDRMLKLFTKYRPDTVFHSAAYKHVPLMEAHPYEAVKVNILGTKLIADLSLEHGVKKFVMISTDKAVNPTNVMGASKRIAEMYIQGMGRRDHTQFITTRFGNVLGSNGSVIPLFRKQIEQGGPITITHPDITRYFMTIPEACNLVLEAGAMGKGGEIYVFDMGESVKIVDLAKNMIRLSGLTLGRDIEIKYTGLRPGEKLYEELLANTESTIKTHHEKIMIADVREVDAEQLSYMIDALRESLKRDNPEEIVRLMKKVVIEFKSNNSVFTKLDKN